MAILPLEFIATNQEIERELQPIPVQRKKVRTKLDQSEVPLIDQTFPNILVWRNIIFLSILHIGGIYGLWLLLTGHVRLITFLYNYTIKILSLKIAYAVVYMCAIGTSAGAHRLWSHQSFSAKLPLRILLAIFQTMTMQNCIHEWSRDHRLHHKYTETNADPHNAKRGFFFAHVGWLLVRKHPSVRDKGKGIGLTDLENDSVVMFQKKYYIWLVIIFSYTLPSIVPIYFWQETYLATFYFTLVFRLCAQLNFTWLVNSAAHLWGTKPFDKSIQARDNSFLAFCIWGDGTHNYHHVFPWDYRTSELGNYFYSLSTIFLDFMAKIGWAYNLKTVPPELILQRMKRTGDGSHIRAHSNGKVGWGDKDITIEDMKIINQLYPL